MVDYLQHEAPSSRPASRASPVTNPWYLAEIEAIVLVDEKE